MHKNSRVISMFAAVMVSVLVLGSEASAQVKEEAPAEEVQEEKPPVEETGIGATLEGESFRADGRTGTVTCDPTRGQLYFAARGIAAGQFPGTFIEEGFISFDPNPAGAKIFDMKMWFVVADAFGKEKTVTGSTFLSGGVARCALDTKTAVTTFSATVYLKYQASMGGIPDYGEATLDLGGSFFKSGQEPGELLALKFTQIFHSSSLVISTLGKVTGGGSILQGEGGRGVTFGFNANNTDKGMKGSGSIIDHSVGTTVKIREVTTLAVAGTHATILGTAEVNGVVEDYRIDVDDLGEPGADGDTFKIVTNTYGTAGILTGGNIQIH
jgi:hypothetical protein